MVCVSTTAYQLLNYHFYCHQNSPTMDIFPNTWTLATAGSFLLALFFTVVALFIHWFGLLDLLFNEVERKSKRNGGELVASTLKSHGVKWVFTLCGGHISPVLVACEKQGVRVVDTRHEVTCVFAADAVARLSGVIGVACVTAGPGLTNTITAVKNASMAESPVLVLGGAAATIMKGRGSLQDIDQMSLFKPLCKFTASIKRVRDIVPTLRKAIQVANSNTPGPVFVELPIDSLYPYAAVVKEIFPKGQSNTLRNRLVKAYLVNYVDRLFAGAFKPRDSSPLPISFPRASQSEVSRCASLLRKAKKPVFLLGSQVSLPPAKSTEVRAALEKMGVPCFLGGMSRGYLGRNSPIHIRQKRKVAVKEADVVVCLGAVADFRLSYGRIFSSKSKIVAVNRSKSQLTMNTDSFWRPALSVNGDPGLFTLALAEALDGYECPEEWLEVLRNRDKEVEVDNRKKADVEPEQHLNPLKVLYHTEEALDENTILVADGGDFVGSAAYILRPRGPLKWLDPGAFGTLGVGGGFALGAKLCNPDDDVWIIYGDGSLGYSVAEFDTFARNKIPVIALIGNDACWTQIKREQVPMFGSDVACNLSYCEYDVVANGFGGVGYKLTADSTTENIKDTLEKAKELSRGGTPVLINALIGKSDFREGSISV